MFHSIEITEGLVEVWEFEGETVLEETSRGAAVAEEREIARATHQPGAESRERCRRRRTPGPVQCAAQGAHELAICHRARGIRIEGTAERRLLDRGQKHPIQIFPVNPADELLAATNRTAEEKASQSLEQW